MDKIEAMKLLSEIKHYLTAGNPVWDVDEIAEACDMAIESLPSAEAEDRLYIKIYADDEPSVMAEKLYQICGETQNGEVAKWLKEYFPSAEPKTGEWILTPMLSDNYRYECSNCMSHHRERYEFCPSCGSRMLGEDGEA